MPSHAAIANETSQLIKYRQSRNGYVALATVRRWARELKIPERQVRIKRFTVLAPAVLVRLHVGHFPARLADLGARRRCVSKAFGKFLSREAMLRVTLPVHVEGELDEGPKAFLARAQLILGLLALGDVAHQAQIPASA